MWPSVVADSSAAPITSLPLAQHPRTKCPNQRSAASARNRNPAVKLPKGTMRSKQMADCVHGMTQTCALSSPIGTIAVVGCPWGLHSVGQNDAICDGNFVPLSTVEVNLISACIAPDKLYTPIKEAIGWLRAYFQDPNQCGHLKKPELCMPPRDGGTYFREQVWMTLADSVGIGQTVSYGELAKMVGNPGAARAVGTAMRMNPFQLIVPCHRVIRSDASLGQYASGQRNKVKEWLLNHECAKGIKGSKMRYN